MANGLLDRKYIDGRILDQLHPQAKGIKPGYTRTIETLYTDGKIEDWRETNEKSPITLGIQYNDSVRDSARHLYSKVLIDVRACAEVAEKKAKKIALRGSMQLSFDGRSNKQSEAVKNANQIIKDENLIIKEVFTTLMHEFFHVVQAWIIGRETFEGRFATAARKGYSSNRYENAAFDREHEISQNSSIANDLKNNKYDHLLPIDMIQRISG